MKPYPKYKDTGIEWLGKVPEGWEVRKLKYVAHVEMGQSPESDFYNKDRNGVPFLQGNADFKEIYPQPQVWTTEGNKYSKKDDILISVRAPVGEINISDNRYAIGRGLTALRFSEKFCFKYYYYLVAAAKNYFDSISTGTTYSAISTDDVKNISVAVPLLEKQLQIANFLDQKTDKIDELIKKNERLVEILKEKRQAVISHAVTKGLDPNVKMKDSGIEWIGEIPEGWQTMPLRRIGRVVNGGTPESSNAYYWDGDIVWVTPDDLGKNQSKYITESKRKLTDEGYKSCSTTIIPKNSLIISTRAPIGHLALSALEICFNQGCRGIVFQNNYNPSFYYYYFSSLKDVLNSYGQGSTFFELGADKLASFYVAIPSLQEQIQIVTYLDQKTARIDETIKKILSQIDKLKEYRQALISNVVTGKVRV